MALTNCYCTVDEFMTFTRIGDFEDAVIHDLCLNAASRMVDRYTGRRHGFWQDSSVKTREYHADDAWRVQTDDISTTTGLIVKTDTDGTYATTLTITTDFLPYPRNADDDVPVRPFDELVIVSSIGASLFVVSRGPGVQVTAKFGWPAVPDDVKLATLLQAQMLYSAKDARAGLRCFSYVSDSVTSPCAMVDRREMDPRFVLGATKNMYHFRVTVFVSMQSEIAAQQSLDLFCAVTGSSIGDTQTSEVGGVLYATVPFDVEVVW